MLDGRTFVSSRTYQLYVAEALLSLLNLGGLKAKNNAHQTRATFPITDIFAGSKRVMPASNVKNPRIFLIFKP
jgi:hypothetical protein